MLQKSIHHLTKVFCVNFFCQYYSLYQLHAKSDQVYQEAFCRHYNKYPLHTFFQVQILMVCLPVSNLKPQVADVKCSSSAIG